MPTIEAQGSVIAIGDGASPEVFSEIMEVQGIAGPDGSANEIDVTKLSSVAREIRMGLADEGSITLEGNYDRSDTLGQNAAEAARAARTLKNFEITLTDSPPTVFTFAGFVLSFTKTAAVDDVWKFAMNIRISGSVTIAP